MHHRTYCCFSWTLLEFCWTQGEAPTPVPQLWLNAVRSAVYPWIASDHCDQVNMQGWRERGPSPPGRGALTSEQPECHPSCSEGGLPSGTATCTHAGAHISKHIYCVHWSSREKQPSPAEPSRDQQSTQHSTHLWVAHHRLLGPVRRPVGSKRTDSETPAAAMALPLSAPHTPQAARRPRPGKDTGKKGNQGGETSHTRAGGRACLPAAQQSRQRGSC
jgi:hypothetical protein